MDYEKKYKKLVSKIEKAYLYAQTDSTKAVLEEIRPELKESEGEKIRKGIIKFLIDVNNGAYTKSELEIASWIAWLEKQGKQKPNPCDGCINRKGCINCENGKLREIEQPADKIEPKFKETPKEKAEVEEREDPILQRLDRIYDLLLHKLNEKIIINNPFPRLTETPYKPGEVWCGSDAATSEGGGEE